MKTPEEVAAELAKRYTVDDGYVPDADHWPALQRAIATAIRAARAEGMREAATVADECATDCSDCGEDARASGAEMVSRAIRSAARKYEDGKGDAT